MDLQVTSLSVEAVLSNLLNRNWLIPQFQREFVWEVNDVIALTTSILEGRPIGMATLWTQAPDSVLELEPISLPDTPDIKYYSKTESNPLQVQAIIDGKQRCTAIAMAFGGFRPNNNSRKFAGRYYLSINDNLDSGWEVIYYKESEVRKNKFDNLSVCFANGLFPLYTEDAGKNFVAQWMGYLSMIDNKSIYKDGEFPSEELRQSRKKIIEAVFTGLIDTKLAIYILPIRYTLAEICDIFETLNTTGTKVSTVDLIHSWLYNESIKQNEDIISLRDWIDELGSMEGAIGWANKINRPELTAQIVTGCYLALDNPPQPKKVGKSNKATITSVKSADLLATPHEHWKNVINHSNLLASFMGDFQKVVAGSFFPFSQSPYPISSAIYVGLRWHHKFEKPNWSIEDLNALFGAFFWRNALSSRYDQGFLTQLGTDLKTLKVWLETRDNFTSSSAWAENIQIKLETYIKNVVPDKKQLINLLTDKRPSGALFNALTLLMYANVNADIVDSSINLSYPLGEQKAEFHHIYPKKWCSDNVYGELKSILDKEIAGRDYIDSISNLMPLSKKSNSDWKTKNPAQFLYEKAISYKSLKNIFDSMFIDEEGYNLLISEVPKPRDFWMHRAKLMSEALVAKMDITYVNSMR
jgi:hypothetical protein